MSEATRRPREPVRLLGLLVTLGAVLSAALLALPFPVGPPAPDLSHGPVQPPRLDPAALARPQASLSTPIHHVIVVMLENEGLSAVLAGGAFERYLWEKYAHSTAFFGLCHPSLGNYLAATSGTAIGCGTDNFHTYSLDNIGALTAARGLSWMSFAENMSAPCSSSNNSLFSNVFTPLLHYQDVAGNRSYCDSHILPVTPGGAWYQDINGTMPSFVWYAPNKIDNGHSSNLTTADRWLRGWLSPLLNKSWAASTAFLLAYDEGSDSAGYTDSGNATPTCTASTAATACGGAVWMVAVSPYSELGTASNYTANATDYNLLSTAEWLLGVGSTGHNDSSTRFGAMRSLFALPVASAVNYTVSGRVVHASNGTPVSGATVALSGGSESITDAAGAYSISTGNGTYTLSAQAPGCVAASVSVTVAGANLSENFTLDSPPPPTYSVSGIVTALSSGKAIEGATVSLGGAGSILTGPAGTFVFPVPNGTYPLSAVASGFARGSATVVVSGGSVVHNLQLAAIVASTFPISGRVVAEATGSPVAGANVSLSADAWASTNASGGFSLRAQNGTYTMHVSSPGFTSASASVTVSGAPVIRNFTMLAASPPPAHGGSSSPSSGAGSSSPFSNWQFAVLVSAAEIAAAGLAALLWRRRTSGHGRLGSGRAGRSRPRMTAAPRTPAEATRGV